MTDWASGYVADIGYTYGYYLELNPQRVKLAFLNAGLVFPEFCTACELGFGQGLSANIHAAASVCSWHGTDFNPSQVGFAKELAGKSGADIHLFDESFTDFASRDLPAFDYIGLHGIWSWISDDNRAVIVDFISKKLKVGGVLYISYNTLPGWATFAPIRHLMTEHAEIIGTDGEGIVNRIDGALNFTERLLATAPLYVKANPLVNQKIKQVKEQNRHYLAHEYFNRDWHPMHFATMAEWMRPAKLTYACSAHYLDAVDALNLTKDQQAFVNDIHDPIFKQTVQDFMVNQQFRKDYWVKGSRHLTPHERVQSLKEQRLIMTAQRSDTDLKVTGALGEATVPKKIYDPVLDLMADRKIRSIEQIEQAVKDKVITFAQLIQVVLVLCSNDTFSPVQEDLVTTKVKMHTDKLNTHLISKAFSHNDINTLVSPVTGGGFNASRIHQLFILALQQGKKKPEEWAAFVLQTLSSQGQGIVKGGKAIDTTQEQLAELTKQAIEFESKQLPIFKALQII